MHLAAIHVTNFRRLKDVHIDFDEKTTVFVGSNNSGKTSATHVLDLFLGSRPHFTIHDFNADTWKVFDEIGENAEAGELPTITLDLWFKIAATDLHRVIAILPSLKWQDTPVGVRLQFAPKEAGELLANYQAAKLLSDAAYKLQGEEGGYRPWPENLSDYLNKKLRDEYRIHYYVLDSQEFDAKGHSKEGYSPRPLNDEQRTGASTIASLIRVDFLDAQRHLSDRDAGGRAENLSRRLSKFYERNLEKFDDDFAALSALAGSEKLLNEHLKKVFGTTLQQLNQLGYPGFADPHLEIRSAFVPESLLTQNARVHYAVQDPGEDPGQVPLSLPDQYNGLGFKNLIYMVVEVLDFHQRWANEKSNRPPVHLVVIEEPEAHLHAQLQQVFIKKILDILPKETGGFVTQLTVTTHSPHIIYEDNFKPVRYFRRTTQGQPRRQSEVLDLSHFYNDCAVQTRSFLAQYMKLTHSDLFFADAAILVEGNVERLLLPLFIERTAPELQSSYLTVLELGGAFAHIFEALINFLGLTTLVITDLDSVHPKAQKPGQDEFDQLAAPDAADPANDDDDDDDEDDDNGGVASGRCLPSVVGAVTSNQTLIKWIPKLTSVAELLAADDGQKTIVPAEGASTPRVCVAYQTPVEAKWGEEAVTLAGRALEEAFALENLAWTQDKARRHLGLRVPKGGVGKTTDEMAALIHKRVSGSGFDKTRFALHLMTEDPDDWKVPTYIRVGLEWLRDALPHSKVAKAVLAVEEKAA